MLTFPSLGTFDSLWRRIDQEMAVRGLLAERRQLDDYLAERPSAAEARGWLERLDLARIVVTEYPLMWPLVPAGRFSTIRSFGEVFSMTPMNVSRIRGWQRSL